MCNNKLDIFRKSKGKLSDKRGMTMAEMLITVAIIIILSAVAFISIIRYQRVLAQLERDKVAQEIFIAAQNHLTVAKGQNYLGLNSSDAFGIEDKTSKARYESSDGSITEGPDIPDDYYFIVNGSIPNNGSNVLSQMLPFGSIDETVRIGGSYLVRYQKSTGTVLDVFYCTDSNSRFGYKLRESDYVKLMSDATTVSGGIGDGFHGTQNKTNRRDNFIEKKAVVGWYGGTETEPLPEIILTAPEIEVINAERLYVRITDKNEDKDVNGTQIKGEYKIRLFIKGVESKKQHYVDVAVNKNKTGETYTVLLDDITNDTEAVHFCNKQFYIEGSTYQGNDFKPGEDLVIQAVAYSTTKLANIAYSDEKTDNSLFSSKEPSDTTKVYIKNIRHLENLDSDVSDCDFSIRQAVQMDDLDWNYDKQAAEQAEKDVRSENPSASADVINSKRDEAAAYWTTRSIKNKDASKSTTQGHYMPITPRTNSILNYMYNGNRHSISNITASDSNAGMFGALNNRITIKDIKLVDFKINGTSSAGALAGSLSNTGTKIINVLAYNTGDDKVTGDNARMISGNDVGGLIGRMTGGIIQYSAAALRVNGTNTAGGLIGNSTAEITGCYSGGHTKDGSYLKWIYKNGDKSKNEKRDGIDYDVIGATAGGLVGNSAGAITNSYSTCSVSGSLKAGGLVGNASRNITNCYATGLIDTKAMTKGDDSGNGNINKFGAFAGSCGTVSDCKYYSIISEVTLENKLNHYLKAVGDRDKNSIKAIDDNANDYDAFVGKEWKAAVPYDVGDNGNGGLKKYYDGKYNLRTVSQLKSTAVLPVKDPSTSDQKYSWEELYVNTHYGDWPAPEVFIINN